MPEPLVTSDDLALVLDEAITPARFDALYKRSLSIVRSGFDGDPEDTTGRTRDVVSSVLFGVMVRIVANPKGARVLNAGAAGVTFGGSDGDIANIFSLSEAEREDLATVSTNRVSSGAFTIRAKATPYRNIPRVRR